MRNAFKFLVAGALVAGTITAQEQSASVESILEELGQATGSPAVQETSSAVESDVAQTEIPVAVMDTLDIPATLDGSRELYVSGEFEQAQRGFEAVVKKDPENVVARMYLRKLLERDSRRAEVSAMNNTRNEWKSGLVLRSYEISEDAVEKIGLQGITDSVDVTGKFPEVGFPEGSSAVYQPKTGKLFIRNTPQNLQIAEEIMDAMDVAKLSSDVDQVEIEAKFVEVSEGTLEMLGFEWTAADDINLGDGAIIEKDENLFSDSLRGGKNELVPFFSGATSLDSALNRSGWSAFRFEDSFSTNVASLSVERRGSSRDFDTLITALDQSTGTDVLSAPRVVTRSGEKATIRVGEIHYYPEVYEVGANEGNPAHITYQDFSERLLGVQLDVQPQVDGDEISLKLNPKVTELAGWQTFSVVNAPASYTYYQYRVSVFATHEYVTARLPVFNRREIDTEVTINDGATIGMGGLISEKIEQYEDKVPVLGSLPLVGRLFRNEGERAVKRNLMIFVTAKRVEASGRINTARAFE